MLLKFAPTWPSLKGEQVSPWTLLPLDGGESSSFLPGLLWHHPDEKGNIVTTQWEEKSYIPTGPSQIPPMQRYTGLWGFGLFASYYTLPSRTVLHKYVLN